MNQYQHAQIAEIFIDKKPVGELSFINGQYRFSYFLDYDGPPVSLTLPLKSSPFLSNNLPPFFEGLLPEGLLLEALLRKYKVDRNDVFAQLLVVGQDVVGNVRIEAKE